MKQIQINGKYNENNISSLILKLNFVFKLENKEIKNYDFQVKIKHTEFTSITSLIIYKILAYSLDNKCLDNPSANIDEITDLFSKFHLHELIKAYYDKKDVDRIFSNIKPLQRNDFFVAPHPINREVVKSKDDLSNKYYEIINNYYKDKNFEIVEYIKTCLVEISSNFLYHAENDEKSILMAEGNKTKVEIISVDTSEGIITTMKEKYNKSDTNLLNLAFQRKITSKIENGHCGTGLWLVNEIVTRLKGKLIIHTEGYIYRNIQGNISTFASSYWKGTIVYIKLPITEVIEINKFFTEILSKEKTYI
ncbi:hypothetical protein [Flavobacterium sp.]|jgi:hypothetical protein|uniref:hypothetical protein n=1 Tax=Flavobacterium sp. TaxID=239 RepID=UPI0037BFB31D